MKSSNVEQMKIVGFVLSVAALVALGTQFLPLTVESIPGWHPRIQSVPPRIYWHAYSTTRIESLNASGRHVLVNYRVNWHLGTVIHETYALDTDQVRYLLHSKQVVPMRAECSTMPVDTIDRMLEKYASGHIPLVVIHSAYSNRKPIVLEAPISESQVIAALKSL